MLYIRGKLVLLLPGWLSALQVPSTPSILVCPDSVPAPGQGFVSIILSLKFPLLVSHILIVICKRGRQVNGGPVDVSNENLLLKIPYVHHHRFQYHPSIMVVYHYVVGPHSWFSAMMSRGDSSFGISMIKSLSVSLTAWSIYFEASCCHAMYRRMWFMDRSVLVCR
jgi:hypothetical protein